MKHFIELIRTNIAANWFELCDYVRVVRRFYGHALFRRIDLALAWRYFFLSPYTINRRFRAHHGDEDLHEYGDTPLTTLAQIAAATKIGPDDVVYDLGCGTGHVPFWLHCFTGCRAVGIDRIPAFIAHATAIASRYQIDAVSFIEAACHQVDLTPATVIYFYGSTCSDAQLAPLIAQFRKLRPGTRIITATYSLNEILGDASFPVQQQCTARYPWGETPVFIQQSAHT
jgi:precorrin-6B methylase 2